MQVFDLGEIWQRFTGLPFVFGLWMIRRDIVKVCCEQIVQLDQQLHESLARTLENPWPLAHQYAAHGLTPQQVVDYWKVIDYRLEKEHLDGLQLFFELCVKCQLLDQLPEIHFFSATACGQA